MTFTVANIAQQVILHVPLRAARRRGVNKST